MRTLLVVLCAVGVVFAQTYSRVETAPNCATSASCQLLSRDHVNNNDQNSNITTLLLDTSNNAIKGVFSYQGANRPGVQVLPVSSQAQVTFASIAEWNDSNSDNIPQTNELSNMEMLTPPTSPLPTFDTSYYLNSMYIPYAAEYTYLTNFSATCYIVKNQTYFVPPDLLLLDGYGGGCHLQITKSVAIAPTSRLALIIYIDTALAGSGVEQSLSTFQWSLFTGATGSRLQAGYSWVMLQNKATIAGQSTANTMIDFGVFEDTDVSGQVSLALGLQATGVNSFEYDLGFEPVSIFYQSEGSSVGVSLFVLLSSLLVAFAL